MKWISVPVILLALFFAISTSFAQDNVEKTLKEAYGLYNQARFQDAIIKTTDLLTTGNLDKGQEVRALQILSLASYGLGHVEESKQYLTRMVGLDPLIELDADEYPPQVLNLWYKVREEHPVPEGAGDRGTEIQTIAVMYFDNNSIVDHDKLEALSKGLPGMMIHEITKVSDLKVLERDRINYLVEELKLQQSDLVDQGTAVRIGKLLGAHTLLMGGFMKLSDDDFRIDARLVKVETGEIIKAEYVEGEPKKIMELEKNLVMKLLANLDVTPSDEEKEEIMKGRDASFDALYHYSRGLAYEDKKDYMAAYQQYQKALEIAPGYVEAQKKMSRLEPFSSQG